MEPLRDGKSLICISNIDAFLNDNGDLDSSNHDPRDIHFREPEDWIIKPEPMEFYIPVWKSNPNNAWETAYKSKEHLLSVCDEYELLKAIKVREVIE